MLKLQNFFNKYLTAKKDFPLLPSVCFSTWTHQLYNSYLYSSVPDSFCDPELAYIHVGSKVIMYVFEVKRRKPDKV